MAKVCHWGPSPKANLAGGSVLSIQGVECSTWSTQAHSRASTPTRFDDVQERILGLDCACRWTNLSGNVTACCGV